MKRKILIIDDDEEMCEEIADILSYEGYDVQYAFNGLDGKRLISENEYDLLLLDLKIPKINGFDILKRIKAEDSGTKVLVITGRPLATEAIDEKNRDADGEMRALKLADGIISKPFNVDTLLNEIEKSIGRNDQYN